MINAIYDGEDIQVLTNLQKETRFFIAARYELFGIFPYPSSSVDAFLTPAPRWSPSMPIDRILMHALLSNLSKSVT